MKQTSLATIANVLSDYFNTGSTVRDISARHRINHTSVSLYISRFIHAFGDAAVRNETPVTSEEKRVIDFSEEYLLKLSDKDFQLATGINPNNRYADSEFFETTN